MLYDCRLLSLYKKYAGGYRAQHFYKEKERNRLVDHLFLDPPLPIPFFFLSTAGERKGRDTGTDGP